MSAPTPVTMDRITQILEGQGLQTQADPSGKAILIPFANIIFICQLAGTTFSVQGVWRGDLADPSDRANAIAFVQGHNANALVPKVYMAENDGEFKLHTESNTVVPTGLNDEQLLQFLQVSLTASIHVAGEVEKKLPHLVTWSEEVAGGTKEQS